MIKPNQMPLLIGVGDTVTSQRSESGYSWLRGGSDRGFLTLLQELGRVYAKGSKVLLVDSSRGEVVRPNLENENLIGISDPEDPLKFNTLFKKGTQEYINWFSELSKRRVFVRMHLIKNPLLLVY